jgi:2-polyprenyl-3-methyl-5-hydroxy-6-metoxy-1,4-benzoquinol methylase
MGASPDAVVSPPRSPSSCPLCGGHSLKPSVRFRVGGWNLWNCTECSSDFLFPIPSQDVLTPYYAHTEYGRFLFPGGSRHSRAREERLARLLEQSWGRGTPAGLLLDMGCSRGEFLRAASRQGWAVEGVEVDPDTAAIARDYTRARIMVGSGFECLAAGSAYDLIVMSHWLEHVRNPGEQLLLARDHLRPGGKLLIRVPNADCVSARYLRENWSWFIPPIHLHYFTRDSMVEVAKKLGFRSVEVRTCQGDSLSLPVELITRMGLRTLNWKARGAVSASGPSTDTRPKANQTPPALFHAIALLSDGVTMVNPFASLEDGELVAVLS